MISEEEIYVIRAVFEDRTPNYLHVVLPKRCKITYLHRQEKLTWTSDQQKIAAMMPFLQQHRDRLLAGDIRANNAFELSKLEEAFEFFSTTQVKDAPEWQARDYFLVIADALDLIDIELEDEI